MSRNQTPNNSCHNPDEAIFNLVFTNNLYLNGILELVADHYEQTNNFAFIYGGDNLIECYQAFEKMLRIIQPTRRFSLFCLINPSDEEPSALKTKMLKLNKYDECLKVKCYTVDQIDAFTCDDSHDNQKIVHYNQLMYDNGYNWVWKDFSFFYERFQTKPHLFPNVHAFWKRLSTIIQQCEQNYVYPHDCLACKHKPFNLFFVEGYNESNFWCKIVVQNSLDQDYCFLPGAGIEANTWTSCYEETILALTQLKPRIKPDLYGMWSYTEFGIHYHNAFKDFMNRYKNDGYRISNLTYNDLNIRDQNGVLLNKIDDFYEVLDKPKPIGETKANMISYGGFRTKKFQFRSEQDYLELICNNLIRITKN